MGEERKKDTSNYMQFFLTVQFQTNPYLAQTVLDFLNHFFLAWNLMILLMAHIFALSVFHINFRYRRAPSRWFHETQFVAPSAASDSD